MMMVHICTYFILGYARRQNDELRVNNDYNALDSSSINVITDAYGEMGVIFVSSESALNFYL